MPARMRSRRRIDWTELMDSSALHPVWKAAPARSASVALLRRFTPLFGARHPDDLAKRAIEIAIGPVGLVRAGLYFYDARLDLMVGTWGTNLRGQVVDEHHAMFRLGERGGWALARGLSGKAVWTMIDDCPIVAIEPHETRVIGRGWVACTPITAGDQALGMLYNDAALSRAAIDPRKQESAAVLCAVVGLLLAEMPRSRGKGFVAGSAAPHPAVIRATRLLSDDPTLSAGDLAAHIDVSANRLARVFKSEMGVSIVDYRNQLRLERFVTLMNGKQRPGRPHLADAARAAGFGSYAQFHRVFHALRGTTPRAYLAGLARQPASGAARRNRRGDLK
jgi:AraC-like DNA-binding protein